ncbi:MAG TPA: hypothetical protein VMT34_15965 [Aggregatilineales bacterium]|nr:hypothetical protein [Aggregatilineales bacterium]
MPSPSKPVRVKLSDSEQTSAFIIGGGMALTMIATGLAAARGTTANLEAMFFLGALALVGGIPLWLVWTRPWKNFDDWSTPQYTGHEHDAVHEEHPQSETPAQGNASADEHGKH